MSDEEFNEFDESVEENQPQVDSTFKEMLKEYVDLTRAIDAAMADLKTIKDRKAKLEKAIHVYMKGNKIETINTPEMKFKVMKSKRVQPINKGFIEEVLTDVVGSAQAKTLTKHIFANRKYTESEILSKRKITAVTEA